jgi:hypothetical protein
VFGYLFAVPQRTRLDLQGKKIPMRMLLLTSVLLIVNIALSQSQISDIVLVNGKIWTVDRARPEAEAVAILGGRILSVGTTAEIK